jgi:predicted amino acid dehydrogenase
MNRLAALRLALKHIDACLIAVELIEEVQRVKRADGTIARADRGQLMARFWQLVKTV